MSQQDWGNFQVCPQLYDGLMSDKQKCCLAGMWDALLICCYVCCCYVCQVQTLPGRGVE
jgi:hypothetical protein